MRKITHIVIHCTAGPQTQTIESIRNYWRSIGWKRPGYHRIIDAKGVVHSLSDYASPTNGVAGHNANSIHVAYIGGVDKSGKPVDNRTPEQLAAMEKLIGELANQFPGAIILGHRDFSPDKNRNGVIEPNEWIKACPSFSVREWLSTISLPKTGKELRTLARLNLREGPGKNFPSRSIVPANTKVRVIQDQKDWAFVSVNGTTGWMSRQFLG